MKRVTLQPCPPPGTAIVESGAVKRGDWFYIADLGAWTLVPDSAIGEMIDTALVARLVGITAEGNP